MTTDDAQTVTGLADDVLNLVLDAEPLYALMVGIRDRDDRLSDPSVAAQDELEGRLEGFADRLRAEPAGLDRDIVQHIVAAELTRSRVSMVELSVADKFDSPVNDLLTTLPETTITDGGQAAAYLDRLRAIPRYIDGVTERQTAATASGRTAVMRLVEAAAAQAAGLPPTPAGHPLATPAPPPGWDGGQQWAADRDAIITGTLRPAFLRYADALRTQVLPEARDDAHGGLCWLPGGEATYADLVRYHTSTTLDPRQIHQLGLDCVAGLAEEFAELGGRVFGTADLPEIFRRLRNDPALRYRTAEEIVDAATVAIARAEEAAPRWFGRLPGQSCRVRPVPDEMAPNLPDAYYLPPALDGSRPGTYFANTHDPTSRLRHEAESTAFHEAVPGHHFQITIAQERSDLSMLRRIYPFTAYSEGWGLYSERLAEEMGLYSDDVARLGMLAGDAMRAARLVVDTGMHALGWSRERAVAYCQEHTPMAPAVIEVEIDRYLASPAQALAYLVGRTEIQRIRADAERRLGAGFDIRAFHDLVLGCAAVPLGVLDSMVQEWAPGLSSDSAG